jgi:RNA polymerase sigma-70 factor (ECF subfamily)
MTKIINIESDIVKGLKNGDESSAFKVYRMYSKAMFNTLIRITGRREEAEDLLQEAFTKAFSKINSYSGKATFGAWLKRIVINTGLEFIRKKKLEFISIEESQYKETSEDENSYLNPEIVHQAIKKLPSGSRTVLTLFALEGYSHKEIASQLSISESTSKTQYLRGKNLLKDILNDMNYEG